LVLATATGFSDSYQHAIEEIITTDGAQGGSTHPLVKSDMVFFEGPNDGAVFSVGSIAWLGALSYNAYRNDVSEITGNVLRRFVSEPSKMDPAGERRP
jgi:N,N-dimethylformamidase